MARRRNRKRYKRAPIARSKAEKCATRWCRNRRALKSNGYFLKFCWKCKSRQLKAKHPWTYVLNMLRHSARKRNLPFTLTVAEFKHWCLQTGYLDLRGNRPTSMTIDRIDWNEGYHLWNIQTITHQDNSQQGADNTRRDERADTDDQAAGTVTEPDEPF